MFVPWYKMMMLGFEANSVIGLRMMKMAAGGSDAEKEAHLMVREKVDAAIEAGTTLLTGGTLNHVVDRYRNHVAANQKRLSHGKAAGRRKRSR